MFRLLIVDDDKELQSLLADSLGKKYQVNMASTIGEAREFLRKWKFDLILLDTSLPDGNGLRFCSSLRNSDESREVPIIIFTANADVQDKVMAFSLGADDCLSKPFHLEELRVRIEARLKRWQQQQEQNREFRIGNLYINVEFQRVLLVDGNAEVAIETTPLEFRLLCVLASHEDKVFTREQLIKSAWGQGCHISERAVDTHLSNLRKKLSPSSHTIKSIHGIGYKFARLE